MKDNVSLAVADDVHGIVELVAGSQSIGHTLLSTLHFLFAFFALLLKLPFHLLYHYVFFRYRSPLVKVAGRNPFAELINHSAKIVFNNFPLAGSRATFATQLFLRGDKWIERIRTDEGVKGVWIRPPGTEREKDELVLYWIHGGAFNHDIVGSNLPFYKSLAFELNERSGSPRQCSLFVLDYHLAPEKVYPSQLIELQAGYQYLVQTLGIDPERVCLGGDSAGGNLVTSFLLHLVKRNPKLPRAMTTLAKPGSVLLMSPWTSLLPLESRPSRSSPIQSTLDFLTTPGVTVGAYQYRGLEPPFVAGPSWNPLKWFGVVQDEMPHLEKEDEINELFNDPYLSPGPETLGKENWDWYGKAFPHERKTCVVWGGMEIFAHDVESFVLALRNVGVDPVEVYHPLKCHDFPLFDHTFPFLSRTKTGGESSNFDYGLKKMVEFLRGVADSNAMAEKKG